MPYEAKYEQMADVTLKNRHGYGEESSAAFWIKHPNFPQTIRRTLTCVRAFLTPHGHYAQFECDAEDEPKVAGLFYMDAEDMDAFCEQWLKSRGKL